MVEGNIVECCGVTTLGTVVLDGTGGALEVENEEEESSVCGIVLCVGLLSTG